ncbi:recombinase zinc beta ribbon domain-containing protein [Saccharopolyspora sp. NPDC002686]|uniref:recombinase zinc beta ribbon domain-containing protein n=1 Tax=Saccharopolyspora sp. NPDC002686 TaxID=3154541 RepID=UPI00332A5F74
MSTPRSTCRSRYSSARSPLPCPRPDVREWEVSEQLSHPALVDESTFLAVQRIRAVRATRDGVTRRYELADLVVCGECDRRMDAHWVHGRAGYRCRHTATGHAYRGRVRCPAPSTSARIIFAKLSPACSGSTVENHPGRM